MSDLLQRLQKLQTSVQESPEKVFNQHREKARNSIALSDSRPSSPERQRPSSLIAEPGSIPAQPITPAGDEEQGFIAGARPSSASLISPAAQQLPPPPLTAAGRMASMGMVPPEPMSIQMQMLQQQQQQHIMTARNQSARGPPMPGGIDPRAIGVIEDLRSQLATALRDREELIRARDELQNKLFELTSSFHREMDEMRSKDVGAWKMERDALQKELEAKKEAHLEMQMNILGLTRDKDLYLQQYKDAKTEGDRLRQLLLESNQERGKLGMQVDTLRTENHNLNDTVGRIRSQLATRPTLQTQLDLSAVKEQQTPNGPSITSILANALPGSASDTGRKKKGGLSSGGRNSSSTAGQVSFRDGYEAPPSVGSSGRSSNSGRLLSTGSGNSVTFGDDISDLAAAKMFAASGGSGGDDQQRIKAEASIVVAQKGVQRALAIPRVRRLLINMFLHIAFVCLIIFAVNSTREFKHGYTMSSSIRSLYLDNNWQSIATQYDVWNWVTNTFAAKTFAFIASDYNTNLALPLNSPPNPTQSNINENSPSPPTPNTLASSDNGYILSNMYLMGGIRVRQLRMAPGSCGITNMPSFQSDLRKSTCPQAYSYFQESTASFGGTNKTAFTYDSTATGTPFFGKYGTYNSGGFVVMLPGNDSAAANAQIGRMMTNDYLDRYSSAMFVEMLLFQPSTQLFSIVRFVFEFPITGGVYTYPSLYVINLNKYGSGDVIVMVLEALVLLYICKMGYDLATNIKRSGRFFFKKFFNWFDLANFVLYVIVIAIRIRTLLTVSSIVINPSPLEYFNLGSTALLVETETNCFGFNGILSFLKLFDFLGIFPRLSMLSATLKQASKDISAFLLIFFIIVVGFAQSFYVTFGKYLSSYSDLATTLSTLFQVILGNFNYSELAATNRLLGPLLFMSFVALSFFVLSNMFIALLTDAFSVVKDEIRKKTKQRSVADDLKEFLDKQMKALASKMPSFGSISGGKSKLQTVKDELKGDMEQMDSAAFASLKAKLGDEIAKYDLNGDGILDKSEIDMMMSALTLEERTIVKREGLLDKELEARRNGLDVDIDREERERQRDEGRKVLMDKVDSLCNSVPNILGHLQIFEERLSLALALLPSSSAGNASSGAGLPPLPPVPPVPHPNAVPR